MKYKITSKNLYFTIVCFLLFVFVSALKTEAGSLGSCDPAIMSIPEYEACVQSETNGTADEKCESGWDETGRCKDNATTYDGTYEVPSGNGSASGTYSAPATTYTVPSGNVSANSGGWDPGALARFSLPSSSIYFIISNILHWLLLIFSLLAVIGFIISGIMYIISTGDDDTMQKAKKAMTYSIIGVVVGLSGLIIIYAIERMLRGYSYF
jgi:hypothetical protein